MITEQKIKVLSNFFLDGSKIVFGSIVVGSFLPNTAKEISWTSFLGGLVITAVFLTSSMFLSDKTTKLL